MSAIPASKAFNKLQLLKLMLTSREGDRREGILLRQSKGWFQVSGMGHEALAALSEALRPHDYVFPYYRDRALMLARGVTNYEMALAYFGKLAAGGEGRQMPGHYSNFGLNIFSVCTPTGSGLLPACGAAWGLRMSGSDAVVVTCVGDAATRQGEVYEAIAFALQEKLPVIFLVEDNKYGISTPTEKYVPTHLGLLSDENVVQLNGRKAECVYEAGVEAVRKARAGQGPTVLWCDIDRLSSHTSSDDHRVYRAADDIAEMNNRDPIRLLKQDLIESGQLTEGQFTELQEEVARQVDSDYLRAEREADPTPDTVLHHSWGEPLPAKTPPLKTGTMTMVHAINAMFRKALEIDDKVIFFGEDIEDPKGGVFGLTKGLSEAFPRQVFNAPLAEATILGSAVGLAAIGYRPVFEFQFIDFISPAWNQLCSQVSSLRWRTCSEWKCPMVMYAPYGAYLPGGSLWHSMSNEGMLAHVPGIKIAVPATPEDAAGLFWTAIHGDDPTLILIPKHIFRKHVEVEAVASVPFGKARYVRRGADVTVVVWGNTIELAEAAAAQLEGEVDLEIIDLRSIVPCDYDTITESLRGTGRLVVVHEDNLTCGFGQAIVAEMTRCPERWNLFLSPPQVVARPDVHIGFNPIYEYAVLPDVARVVAAIKTVME
jgi:2-oxoisovalerate dehydrogenase E1 component